ncbi:MAG: CDGSH iron-sulfur domain-containing protein [Balneolaceae bacterium]|nr:CDGSH iron-sulfur domain-containing protein [Balneolaceae bacterium]
MSQMRERIFTYESNEIKVTWDQKRCIHAEECVHGLNDVFDPDQKPWIQPEKGSAEEIADVIERCPTGALKYEVKSGERAEKPSSKNRIKLTENGPIYFFGDLKVQDSEGNTVLQDTRFAMCRCGASNNKPACDNSHKKLDWSADVDADTSTMDGLEDENQDKLLIKLMKNGPVLLEGMYTLESSKIGEVSSSKGIALCRCGGSSNKPLCDGTHKEIGFKAD